MKEEQARKHMHLILGYSGLLLIGLAILRNLSVARDHVGYGLTMFGYLFLVSYFKFADDKIGATRKEKAFYRIGFFALLAIVALNSH
ncbi:hypothetical protein [Rossellomorea arthrocnemi]|uniref:hypothetical protein n=1 Tax=Rossellomorea arthrocnemi TaxID=2769542 RepID=UPI00191A929E|nr:hypothetical protein [Rossellomorea arthrocnemi]